MLDQEIKQRARELGFSMLGIIPARAGPHLNAYLAWIRGGMHGDMGYLARPDRVARRQNLSAILPGVNSMIVAGMEYLTIPLPESIASDPLRGRISNYAWGRDYHEVMLSRLEALARFITQTAQTEVSVRAYVDTGAILERDHGAVAGLGFIGKNTMLIHSRRGSFFFLGEILTDLILPYDDPPIMPGCGSCTRCLAACPTNAFPRPYVLDARRCISYLTIEHKRSIPVELRPLMGNWVYGCDVCQTVCPWQRFVQPTPIVEFYPVSVEQAAPPLADLLALTPESFAERFRGTAIYRLKRDRLVRNACIAAGNSGAAVLADLLRPLLSDESLMVREHATWALERLADG